MFFVHVRFGRQHLKATLLLSVEHDMQVFLFDMTSYKQSTMYDVQVFLLDLISYKQLTLCMDSA